LALLLFVAGCAADVEPADSAASSVTGLAVSDPAATARTRTVFANLASFGFTRPDPFDRRVLLGQQDADISNRRTYGPVVVPDVTRVTGKRPGLVSYELTNGYPLATNGFDAAAFRDGRGFLRARVLEQRARGALASFVWHVRCPKEGPNERDRYAPDECPRDYRLEELLARKADGREGVHFRAWRAMLDEIAELFWSIKDEDGELVPILFRPFHEMNGDWFWWGRGNAPAVYAAVWREMVTYLRDGRGLHSVLWVYSPGAPSDLSFAASYPGDAFVDVIGFDRYDNADGRFARELAADLDAIERFAAAHAKIPAIAEVGRSVFADELDDRWFTRTLFPALRPRAVGYVALWRNAPWEKFVPEPEDGALADDLRRLATSGEALFAGEHDLYLPLHAR